MTKAILCAAFLTLTPTLAHAAVGTIIEHRDDDSAFAGVLRNEAGANVASYRNAEGWWVYANGNRRLVQADPGPYRDPWVVAGGATFHLNNEGELWFTDMDDSGRRLIGPGDPCPNGTNEDVLGATPISVIYGDAAHIAVRCGNTNDVYLAHRDGSLTPLVYAGLPLTGFDQAKSAPVLQGTFQDGAHGVVSPGDILYSTSQSGECGPDPLCGNFGTFRVRNGVGEALHISEAETSGMDPDERAEVMSFMRGNDMGEVAFVVGSVFSQRVTIYVWRPDGTVRKVASTGDPAVGTGGVFGSFAVVDGSTDVDHFQIDDQGYVSFTARTPGGLTLWHETAAGLQRLVWPGQELFEYPGSEVLSIDAARTSKDGRLAAIVTGGGGGLSSQAVLVQDQQGEIQVAWHREETIYDGIREWNIVGQAGFGDASFAVGHYSNGMDGRGTAFPDNGRLYIGIRGPQESAAVILELDADDPGSGETGGGADTDFDTSGMPNDSTDPITGGSGESTGDFDPDSSGSDSDEPTSTGQSKDDSGGSCGIDRSANRSGWSFAVLVMLGLCIRRKAA